MNKIYSVLRKILLRLNQRQAPCADPGLTLRQWADLPSHHPVGECR